MVDEGRKSSEGGERTQAGDLLTSEKLGTAGFSQMILEVHKGQKVLVGCITLGLIGHGGESGP